MQGEKNLFFSTEVDRYIQESEIIFISVNTPQQKNTDPDWEQAADLRFVESCKLEESQNCPRTQRL